MVLAKPSINTSLALLCAARSSAESREIWYGFNTTLAEDVKRFRFLRSLPGAYTFVQKYMPLPGGPAPTLMHFFDDRADELIDELTRIVFTQNMKSMENFYRWVSKRYLQTFRKIHQGLVDTIFRYNNRQGKGVCLANMGEFCRRKDLG